MDQDANDWELSFGSFSGASAAIEKILPSWQLRSKFMMDWVWQWFDCDLTSPDPKRGTGAL